MNDNGDVRDFVKKRYGEIAGGERTGCSCCSGSCDTVEQSRAVGYSAAELASIPEEAALGLGCGNPTALAGLREGEVALDLGSGAGIDAFLAAKRVGTTGRVIGVDMTEKMVERAREIVEKHGYGNVEFRLGTIEELPVDDASVDVVISNCVINLSVDKERCYREIHRVLRPGGRLLVSDLVTDGELPEDVRRSFDAWAACIAGALPKDDYLGAIRQAGFAEVTIVSEKVYTEPGLDERLEGRIVSISVEARR
ncbi:MAG: arsenite methyltransferase [Candidatus Krumholzibacteriota bacterium]|nr:arsenite methyltransferase [Candidatus Krumholzibacteriota bacterium]